MSSTKVVKYDFNVDLDLSMYPSFVSVLFKRIGNNSWIKYWGVGKGTIIRSFGNYVICEGDVCDNEEIIKLWCGAWFNPLEELRRLNLSEDVKRILFNLMNCLKGLGLIVNPIERLPILLATFLSRRTDYHVNVIKWLEKILTKCVINEDLSTIDSTCILGVGSSYQLKQLHEVLDHLVQVAYSEYKDPWATRGELLKIKYVGPKVVDSYLLFSTINSVFTPSDVHYINFIKKFKLSKLIFKSKYLIPNKQLCLRYGPNCTKCRIRSLCLTGASIYVFKGFSGYVQTMAYVVDKILSRKSKYLGTYFVRTRWCLEKVLSSINQHH